MDNKTTKWRKKPDQNAVARERGAHVENGWPHYSRSYGLCMCLDACCIGISGCKCKGCQCRTIPNLHSIRRPMDLTIEQQKSQLSLANTTSSMPKDGTLNGLQKRHANGGRKGYGKGTADTAKNRLYILRSLFHNSNSMCRNRHSDRGKSMKVHIIIDTQVEGESGYHRSKVWEGDLEILNEREHLVKISVMAEGELQPIVEIPFAKGIGHYIWVPPKAIEQSEDWAFDDPITDSNPNEFFTRPRPPDYPYGLVDAEGYPIDKEGKRVQR